MLAEALASEYERHTRGTLAWMMGLKPSPYAYSLIDWAVRKGFLVEKEPWDVNGNLVRTYGVPDAPEGRRKTEQALDHLKGWIAAQKRIEDWNNGE